MNFSTLPQPQHYDDHDHDGCSGLIFNHYVRKSAMVIFAQNTDDDRLWHRWMEENSVYMFCNFLRMQCSHGVYPKLPVNDKGTITKQPSVSTVMDRCKMTTTLRIGDCKKEDIEGHEAMLIVMKEDFDSADEEECEDFKTPPPRTTKKTPMADESEHDASMPRGWSTSGTITSYRENQWVQHEKVWRDEESSHVLHAGTTFSLGSGITKCDVLVVAIGVFHQKTSGHSRRVTALCSFKKDGLEWDTPQFHSAASIIDCAVALNLDFRSLKGVKPFAEEAVAGMITEESGREQKGSSAFWMELQSPPSPKTSKRSRSGTDKIDTLKPAKIAKAAKKVP